MNRKINDINGFANAPTIKPDGGVVVSDGPAAGGCVTGGAGGGVSSPEGGGTDSPDSPEGPPVSPVKGPLGGMYAAGIGISTGSLGGGTGIAERVMVVALLLHRPTLSELL